MEPKLKKFKQKSENSEKSKNLESQTPDFLKLSLVYPNLKKFIKIETFSDQSKKAILDWNDPYAVIELNKVLLFEWFGIKAEFDLEHLCPTISSRTKYIRWIHDLLSDSAINKDEIFGIDIGTGASCIYPMLGKAIYGWNFVASDIDESSLELAKKNILLNGWEKEIILIKPHKYAENYQILLSCLDCEQKQIFSNSNFQVTERNFEFTMCNPPFFENLQDKIVRKDTTCIATDSELLTKGGEVEFIKQMIEESFLLRDRIHWFTTLIGKKSSLKNVLDYLDKKEVVVKEKTHFSQGRNMRWAVAWSWKPNVIFLYNKRQKLQKNCIYKDKVFCIDTMLNSIQIVQNKLKLFLSKNKIPTNKISENISQAKIYADNNWLISKTDKISLIQDDSFIGPSFKPQIIFTVEFQVISFGTKQNLSLNCIYNNPSNNNDYNFIDSKHLFGLLCREIKQFILIQ